jgi:ABC-2 type transport system ATP-binding protein
MTAVIETQGLGRRYGSFVAVAGVDLEIGEREIFGLVGPNGAGKTTTMRMLATAIEPTDGIATICGFDVVREPDAVRRVIGYMPDTFGVYDDTRVWEYLDFFAHCYGVPAKRRKGLIGDLLELVGLTSKRDAYVQALSRGMQQRLCLAHALVHDPAVLLLDEPASGLDPRARAELKELLRELSAMGRTIVISSHILPELAELCTGVAIIDHGRVLASGPIDGIRARFSTGRVIRLQLLGEDADLDAAAALIAAWPEVDGQRRDRDGWIEFAFGGDPAASGALLTSLTTSGHRVVAFEPVVSDLEELFFQVSAQAEVPA